MLTNNEIVDYITLRGEEVPLKVKSVNQADLLFFSENPRIYSVVSTGDTEPSQIEIQKALQKREHVKQLLQSIKANGGLTDPIFVREDNLVVLEGNSRLAAYRALVEMDPIKWGKIKCKLLPKDIDEDKVFSLLGEYHIIGKQDWAPFEQAGYLYRRKKKHNVSARQMSDDLGITTAKVNHLINVYSFMLKKGETDPIKWSYYDEYLKSRIISKCRKENPNLDDIIVANIKKGEICKATQIRDGLPKIIKAGKKVVKDFVCEKKDFDSSIERAIAKGVDQSHFQTLSKFRKWVTDTDVNQDIMTVPKNIKQKIHYELRKIKIGVDSLEKRMKKNIKDD